MKVLIVFGTRFGSTGHLANLIARELGKEKIKTEVIDLKKDIWVSPEDYDGLLVGVSIAMFRWAKEPKNYLKKFKKTIKMPLGVFISSAKSVDNPDEAIRSYIVPEMGRLGIKYDIAGAFGFFADLSKSYGLKTAMLKKITEAMANEKKKEFRPDGKNDFLDQKAMGEFSRGFAGIVKR